MIQAREGELDTANGMLEQANPIMIAAIPIA
jgi:hypothetical protein